MKAIFAIPVAGKSLGLLAWPVVYLLLAALARTVPGIAAQTHFEGLLAALAAGALARWGLAQWPGLLVGALLGGAVARGPEGALVFATGQVSAAVTVALVLRALDFQRSFARKRDISYLMLAAALGGVPLALTSAVSVCGLTHLTTPLACVDLWRWWCNFVIATVVLAPVWLVCDAAGLQVLRARRAEAFGWMVATLLTNSAIFGGAFTGHEGHAVPLAYLSLLLIGWGALRFGVAGAAIGVLLTAMVLAIETLARTTDLSALWSNVQADWLHISGVVLMGWLITLMLVDRQRAFDRLKENGAALVESEQRFRRMADQAPVLMWMAGTDKLCNYFNRGWLEFTGRTLQQEWGNGWAEGVHPDDLTRCVKIYTECFERRESFEMDYRLRRADGQYRWITDRGAPRYDAAGEFVGYIGSCVDVHERRATEEALREQTSFLRAVLDHAPIGVWMQDASGRLRFVNAAFCRAVGIPEERFLAVPHYAELYPPEVAESCMASDRAALAQETPHVSRERLRFVDGEQHDIEIIKVRLVDADGHPIGLVGLSIDITARLKAEEQMRLLGAAFESAANAILVTDREGRILWSNPAFTTLTGYTAAEAVGCHPADLVRSGVHPPEFFEAMWAVIRSGRVWQGRMVNRRKDRTLYDEEQTITPMMDAEGRITHYIAIKQNITELTHARSELRVSEERYRSLFDRSPIAMYVFDCDTLRFLAVNDTAVRNYGYTREEFLQMTLADIRPPEDVEMLKANVRKLVQGNGRMSSEWRHRCKDGTLISVLVSSSVIDYEGRPAAFAVALDITEKKQLQEQLLRAQRMENIGLLAAGIAHDLNNVLTPLFIAVPMLREHAGDESDKRMLALVQQGADRGAALVRQILAFVRGAPGERHPVQLRHVARDVVTMMIETFPKSIRIKSDFGPDLWPVLADPVQIHQLLLNLCVNARDAMPVGGVLRVGLRNLPAADAAREFPEAAGMPYVVAEVGDTGTGIAPEILTRIWDPFFTTKSPGEGTGLGLSTVRGIVSSLGGVCAVESQVGRGTVFRVALPAEVAPVRGGSTVSARSAGPRHDGELILVVDDEPNVRAMIRLALISCGYRVLDAADGQEGLAVWRARGAEIAAVISDVHMPVLGGEAMIAEMRRSNPAVKVLVITGAGQTAAKFASAWLGKPFEAVELLRALDTLLGRGAPAAPAATTAK